jgi:hypothetical protein
MPAPRRFARSEAGEDPEQRAGNRQVHNQTDEGFGQLAGRKPGGEGGHEFQNVLAQESEGHELQRNVARQLLRAFQPFTSSFVMRS